MCCKDLGEGSAGKGDCDQAWQLSLTHEFTGQKGTK